MGDSRDEMDLVTPTPSPEAPPQARPSRGRRRWSIALAVGLLVCATVGTVVAVSSGGSAVSKPPSHSEHSDHSAILAASGGHGGTSAGAKADAAANTAADGNDNSACAPTTDAATSGGSPAGLEASATKVASGSVNGYAWTLWASKGESGANALENGGLVLDGKEFGLCPGYPNPAELEMLDVGSHAIVYGVIGYAGKATVDLSVGTGESLAPGAALPAPTVAVVNGVSFFIGDLPNSACSYKWLELDSTSPGVSSEHNLGFGGVGEGQGYYIGDNTGNNGACTAGKIDPISFSQGIWDLSPGQWTTSFR